VGDDIQPIFNALIGVCGAAGGWWLNTVWKSVTELQRQNRDTVEKLSRVEVLVAGAYVRKDELSHLVDSMEARLSKKLDHIDAQLASKADK